MATERKGLVKPCLLPGYWYVLLKVTLIDFEGSSFPTAAVPVNSVKFEEAFWVRPP